MSEMFDKYRSRVDIVVGVLCLIFLVLLIHLFNLQVIRHAQYEEIARNIAFTSKNIHSSRGLIYDRNFEPLTRNITHHTFWVNTNKPFDKTRIVNLFASEFGKEPEYYRSKLNSNKDYVPLEINVVGSESRGVLCQMPIQGLNKDEKYRRYYPYPVIVSQLIGFTQSDDTGAIGLECAHEEELKGESGKKPLVRSGTGRRTTSLYSEIPELKDGVNIQLTIDTELQAILYTELQNAMETSGAESANGVLVDPFTGEILAIASVPGFDLNNYQDYPLENQVNSAISTSYEPGSTFKIVSIAAALESEMVSPWKVYYCENGAYRMGVRTIHDHQKHGELSVADIMTYSSNIGVSKIAAEIGAERIYQYARDFGFGSRTGLNLPYESAGVLKPFSEWTNYSGPSVAMGQEMTATTLQLAMAYSVVANGGYLLRPRIIRQRFSSGQKDIVVKPEVMRQVLRRETCHQIMDMLVDVVDRGTGSKARINGFTVAGKTGTAQKFVDGQYSISDYISSFAGIFPAESPRYVCVVSVDSPRYGFHWGNETAAPVVRKVLERIILLGHETYTPDEKIIVDQTDDILEKEMISSLTR